MASKPEGHKKPATTVTKKAYIPTPQGRRLGKILEDHNVKSTVLAEELGIERTHINSFIIGKQKSLPLDILNKIATKYGSTVGWVLNGEGPEYVSQAGKFLTGYDEISSKCISVSKSLTEISIVSMDISSYECSFYDKSDLHTKFTSIISDPEILMTDNVYQRAFSERKAIKVVLKKMQLIDSTTKLFIVDHPGR